MFPNRLVTLLRESILDAYHRTLPPEIWDRVQPFYKLKQDVRDEILRRIYNFVPFSRVRKAALVGSIASHLYNSETDIDIHIIADFDEKSPEFERFQKRAEAASNRNLPGTDHPVQFYFHEVDDDFSNVESAYDLINDKWIKYTPIEKVNINDYYNTFKRVVSQIDIERAELYRNLVDYAELKSSMVDVPDDEIARIEAELEQKLEEINSSITKMDAQYRAVKNARTAAYKKSKRGGDRQALVSSKDYANVLYKLLERYSYAEFLRAIKRYKKERGDVTHDDVKDVAKIVSKSIKKSVRDRLDAKLDSLDSSPAVAKGSKVSVDDFSDLIPPGSP